MWRCQVPIEDFNVVISDCSDGIGRAEFKDRFDDVIDILEKAHNSYEDLMDKDELCKFVSGGIARNALATEEFHKLYSQYFSAQGKPAYDHYLNIRDRAPLKRCPYCRYGRSLTVDHFIPKSSYPEFSVELLNLVPACSDCNKTKLDTFSAGTREQMFHPYSRPFPVDPSLRWLHAELVEGDRSILVYRVDPRFASGIGSSGNPSCSVDIEERIRNQFNGLKLGALYSDVSVQYVVSLAYSISERFPSKVEVPEDVRVKFVRDWLDEEASYFPPHELNSYKLAAVEALSRSDWFIRDGVDVWLKKPTP